MEAPTTPPLKTTPFCYKQWKAIGNPSDFINLLVGEFGDFIHYRGLINFYLINDAALVAQVFKQTHRNFNKQTPIYKRFRHALGNSLVNAEGEHWKRQRKLINPTFTPASVKSFFEVMVQHTNQHIQKWDHLDSAENELNFSMEMNRLALGVSGEILFSNSFQARAEEIFSWVKIISRFSARPPFPIISSPKFPRPLTMKMNQVWKEFKQFIESLVEERQRLPAEHQPNDLFSIFLNMVDEQTGEGMSEQEIAEEILGMIIGSHESTATALTWFFYELEQNPEIETKILDEINRTIGDSDLSYENIGELKYLKQVIYETLRLHPPFWFENRNVTTPVDLGEQSLKTGDLVVLSRYALHRNAKYWPNPDDFNPDRFDESKVNIDNLIRSGCYVPFSTGPRVCIGRHFAMMELIIITTSILKKYHLRIKKGQSAEASTHLTMELKNALMVTLIPRTMQTS